MPQEGSENLRSRNERGRNECLIGVLVQGNLCRAGQEKGRTRNKGALFRANKIVFMFLPPHKLVPRLTNSGSRRHPKSTRNVSRLGSCSDTAGILHSIRNDYKK